MSLSADARERVLAGRKQVISVAMPLDTYAWYRQLRSGQPIVYDEQRGAWLVFRYADVERVLRDTSTFSSQRAFKPDGGVDEIAGGSILGLDPPRHRHLRSLITRAFTLKRVTQLESRIREITRQLLDRVESEDTVDIVTALAFPLPVMVICELLGVPSEDAEQFRSWSHDVVGNNYALRMQAMEAIARYFDALVIERTRNPGTDLISELVQGEVDGARLSRTEVTGACLLLLIAGHETTATLISNAMWCFEEHPQARAEVTAQPQLLPGAIEEILRCRAVVHWMPRVVTQQTRFLDQDLAEGDLVLPMFAAANLDAAQFPDPDRFDIRRAPNRHMGFGFGIHLCLGAALARLEANIALRELLARFPRAERDPTQTLALRPSYFVYALQRYPMRLQGLG